MERLEAPPPQERMVRKKGSWERAPIRVSSLRFCVQYPTRGEKNPQSFNFSPQKILFRVIKNCLSVTTSAVCKPTERLLQSSGIPG